MLNQLIYTRCYPCRDLKNKGQVVRSDGFGVFSMSQGLITNPPIPNYDLLHNRLVAQNGAKENSVVGLFNSYEYTALHSHIFALSYEVARELCKVPRKNGIGHRPGNFIKQCFIGEFSDYPFKWFGASEWSAYKKSENDYYLDGDPDATPPLLPQITGSHSGGYITPAIVKRFVDDGRKEAVKAGIWFLIHELAKPENDRKVLLIKDTPDNVELWIAAIEYAFSSDMAAKITFSTNRTKLGTQADNVLFYYTDANGKLTTILNRSLQQTRHPYNMIVGFHPKDTFCAGLRQTPVSNFVLIDGVSKTFSFSTDESINKSYYSAVIKYDSDIQDFCNAVLPSLAVTDITIKIPDLFDAYKYLLDSNHTAEKWSYGTSVSALKDFLQFGIPKNDALNLYLLDEAFKAYPRFVEEDESNGFKLLRILSDLADACKREKEITGCIVDRVFSSMNDLEHSGTVLAKTWNAVKTSNMQKYLQPALTDIFNDSELGIYSNQFKNAKTETIGTVMEMYFTMLKNERGGINSVCNIDEKFAFLCRAVTECIDDTKVLNNIMKHLSGSAGVVNALAIGVFDYLNKYKPDKITDWWDIIADISSTNVSELGKQLLASKNANTDMIESFLTNRIIRLQKCDKDSRDIFKEAVKKLGKSQKTGVSFFKAWLKVSEISQINQIISVIRNSDLDIAAEKELFNIFDKAVPCDSLFGANAIPVREFKDWAKKVGIESTSVALYDFKKNIENEFKPENALKLMLAFSNLKVPLPEHFTQSKYFKDIARKMADMCDKKLHLVFLGLFNIEDSHVLTQYSDAYVEEVLNNSRKKQLSIALIALGEAAYYNKQITGKTSNYVRDMSKVLESSLALKIPNYYEKKLIEQIERSSVCEKEIKERLISLLKDAEAKATPKGLFGKIMNNINSIFGKH